MTKLKPIGQQVVVVMGASSGIGRETARQFANQGAKVVVSARGEAGLNSLVEEIRKAGGEATAIPADVVDFDQVKAVADRAVEIYGRLDTWIHAAAIALYAEFDQTTPQEFERVIDVNLLGQVYGAMAALPHLKREGRGALIHISSIEGKRAMPYHSAYAASKHGIIGFIDALRLELQHDRWPISVTTIMPASINTPFFAKALTKIGVKPKGIPPIYQPSVVAEAILHAAQYPTRDMFVGGSARMMALSQMVSPKLTDAVLARIGFKGQETNWPKSIEGSSSFCGPVEQDNRVEGDFSDQARATSLYTKLEMNPALSSILSGVIVGAIVALATRSGRNGRTRQMADQPALLYGESR